MSTKPTIVVLILAAVSVVAALVVADRQERPGPSPRHGRLLLGPEQLPIEAVERITLRRGSAPAMVFERAGLGWRQVEPFGHPMDTYSIRRLAVLGVGLSVVRRLSAAESDDVALGFRPPRATVSYEWPGGGLTVELGRRGVAGRTYARNAGDEAISVVTGELYERAVEMDPKEWRDRAIFPGAGVDAEEVVILDGADRTVLQRQRKRWTMVEPVSTRLDGSARDELFEALGRARVGGFIVDEPEDPGRFGLRTPAGSVTVRSSRVVERDGELVREPREERLVVGAPMGVGSQDRFGMIEGRPVVVRLPEAVLRAFFRKPATLVDPTGCDLVGADVKSIVIRGPAGEIRLERDLDRWSAPDFGQEVAREAVEQFLAKLTTARAVEVELRAYPQELEVATVTFYGPSGGPLDTVRVAREPETRRWALENGDDVLRIFPPETTFALTPADFGLEHESDEAPERQSDEGGSQPLTPNP